MIVVGAVGYIETPFGLRALVNVWAQHLSEECRRRFYKNWYVSESDAILFYCQTRRPRVTVCSRNIIRSCVGGHFVKMMIDGI